MIIAIIQARTSSTRLPVKVLLDLEGKTVLERVIARAKASKMVDKVVVATTDNRDDQAIANLCMREGIPMYRGSENDVLDRYYQAAKLFKAAHIVRITSDCPLIDPGVIDEVVMLHVRENADYTSNILKETYPDGEDVEVMTIEALTKAWQEANLHSEREHVTPYIRKNPGIFKQANHAYREDLSNKRWTLDNPEDYLFVKEVYKNLYQKNPLFGMEDILFFLTSNPHIERLNNHINRNEGYAKSLREDKIVKHQ